MQAVQNTNVGWQGMGDNLETVANLIEGMISAYIRHELYLFEVQVNGES